MFHFSLSSQINVYSSHPFHILSVSDMAAKAQPYHIPKITIESGWKNTHQTQKYTFIFRSIYYISYRCEQRKKTVPLPAPCLFIIRPLDPLSAYVRDKSRHTSTRSLWLFPILLLCLLIVAQINTRARRNNLASHSIGKGSSFSREWNRLDFYNFIYFFLWLWITGSIIDSNRRAYWKMLCMYAM